MRAECKAKSRPRHRCGLDDIGLTMEKKSSIDDYEAKLKNERAWA